MTGRTDPRFIAKLILERNLLNLAIEEFDTTVAEGDDALKDMDANEAVTRLLLMQQDRDAMDQVILYFEEKDAEYRRTRSDTMESIDNETDRHRAMGYL